MRGEVDILIYSHIYWGQSSAQTDLSAALSICNTDPLNPMLKIDYYDSVGSKIREST